MKKKLILFTLLIFGVFALMACNLQPSNPDPDPIDQDQVNVDDAASRLNALFPTRGETVSNLTFPATMIHGVIASWSSDKIAVISNTGQVTRPDAGEANQVVIITVTLTLNDASAVRTIEFTVLALPESDMYTDFALLHAEASINDYVDVKGIVVGMYIDGYYLYDGTNYINIYKVNHNVVAMGDEVVVSGRYSAYYSLFQVGTVTTETVLTSGNDTTIPAIEMSIEAVNGLDTTDKLVHGRLYKVTGTVVQKNDADGYPAVFLVDGDFELLLYFKSYTASLDALKAVEGLEVTVNIFYYVRHTRTGNLVVFDGIAADIILDVDDQAAFDTDVANATVTPNYTFGGNVTLPTAGSLGTTFGAWVSSHPAIIGNDGVVVLMPTEPTLVTFTGTATLGSINGPVVVTIDVLAMTTIGEANLLAPAKHAWVEGVIYQFVPANSGFFMYDGTGYMYVRDTGQYATIAANYAVGDTIELIGARADYRGIYQLTSLKLVEASTNVYAQPVNLGLVEISEVGSVYPAGAIVTVRGTAQKIVGTFTNYRLNSIDSHVQIHHNSNNTLFDTFDGQIVEVEIVIFQWDHADRYVAFFGTIDDITVYVPTNEDLAELAKAALDLGDTTLVFENLVLPSTGLHGSIITWVSGNHAALLDDGTIIRGATDVTVTLTATITVGTAFVTKEFTIIVKSDSYVPTGMTVADALLEIDGEIVYVEGVVTSYPAFSGTPGFFIQDLNGTAILVNTNLPVEIGNKVIVRGTLATLTSNSNNRRQLNSATLLANDDLVNAIFVDDTMTLVQIAAAWPGTQNMRFRVENVVITRIAFNMFFFDVDHLTIGELGFDYRNYGQHLVGNVIVGSIIPVIEFTIYDIYYGDIRVEGVVLSELTQNEVEAISGTQLQLPFTVSDDLTLKAVVSIAGVNYDRGADVFNVTWTSNKPAFITDAGVVTRPAIGQPEESVEMTATVDFNGTPITLVYTVGVLAEVDLGGETLYTETFASFFTTASTSYTNIGTATDTNGFAWEWKGPQNLSGIDGNSLVLGNNVDANFIKVTATGGISSFTVDLVRAFTNTNVRTVELFVNGVSQGSFSVNVSNSDVQAFTVDNINIAGEVIIELRGTSPGSRGAVIVDNFSWTTYTP